VGPGRPSPDVRLSFRVAPRLDCPCSGSCGDRLRGRPQPASSGSPLLRFLLPRTQRRRVPRFAPRGLSPGRATRVRVATLPPVPSSGFLPLSTVLAALAARAVTFRRSPFAVAPRRFAALFHAARVPGVALQSFPFSRSRTRSRGPLLPCGFAFDHPTARHVRGFRGPFPRRADPLPRLARRLTGRRDQDDASARSLGGVRCAPERVHDTVVLVRTVLA